MSDGESGTAKESILLSPISIIETDNFIVTYGQEISSGVDRNRLDILTVVERSRFSRGE
jgi:hypothetical protein